MNDTERENTTVVDNRKEKYLFDCMSRSERFTLEQQECLFHNVKQGSYLWHWARQGICGSSGGNPSKVRSIFFNKNIFTDNDRKLLMSYTKEEGTTLNEETKEEEVHTYSVWPDINDSEFIEAVLQTRFIQSLLREIESSKANPVTPSTCTSGASSSAYSNTSLGSHGRGLSRGGKSVMVGKGIGCAEPHTLDINDVVTCSVGVGVDGTKLEQKAKIVRKKYIKAGCLGVEFLVSTSILKEQYIPVYVVKPKDKASQQLATANKNICFIYNDISKEIVMLTNVTVLTELQPSVDCEIRSFDNEEDNDFFEDDDEDDDEEDFFNQNNSDNSDNSDNDNNDNDNNDNDNNDNDDYDNDNENLVSQIADVPINNFPISVQLKKMRDNLKENVKAIFFKKGLAGKFHESCFMKKGLEAEPIVLERINNEIKNKWENEGHNFEGDFAELDEEFNHGTWLYIESELQISGVSLDFNNTSALAELKSVLKTTEINPQSALFRKHTDD
eukprot:Pgem_evm2s18996